MMRWKIVLCSAGGQESGGGGQDSSTTLNSSTFIIDDIQIDFHQFFLVSIIFRFHIDFLLSHNITS